MPEPNVQRRRVTIVGGGPAGLMAARLLAVANPDWIVTLYERLPPDETFGFGVGLSGGTLSALAAADPEVHADVLEAALTYSTAEFRLPTGAARVPGFYSGIGIGRAALLRVLLRHVLAAGVDVRTGRRVDLEEVRHDADVVVAADGVSSQIRERHAAAFGATVQPGRGKFIWCGCETQLEGNVFMPVQTPAGVFVAHAYPYAAGRSTLVIETDALAPERAGLPEPAWVDDAESDEASLEYLSAVFSELVGGRPLIGNRSRWQHFRTVHCARWHHENVVLLGDAAATAHPSLGSGTKLALEDAMALARTLCSAGDEPVPTTLARYQRHRRPAVDRLQARARRSELWWESFTTRMDLSPSRTALAYMTRAGALSLDQVQVSAPSLVAEAVADFADVAPGEVPQEDRDAWVLSRRVGTDAGELPGRVLNGQVDEPVATLPAACSDAWGAEADEVLERARGMARAGTRIVELVGDFTPAAVLDRLALAERMRAEAGVLVAVATDREHMGMVADGIVCGRADLVALVEPRARGGTR